MNHISPKTRVMGLHDLSSTHSVTILVCDRQTDRQMDGRICYHYRVL